MTKRTAVSKLTKAGLVADKSLHKGYNIVQGNTTDAKVRELFGEPRGRFTDYRGEEYTQWHGGEWRLSLSDNGDFVLV